MNLKSKVRFHETVNRAKDLSCLLINQKIDDFFNINDNDGFLFFSFVSFFFANPN